MCPECNDAGYFRRDVDPGHPEFGKLIRCDNAVHQVDRLRRMADISNLGPEAVKRRLDDIQISEENREMLTAARTLIDNPRGWLYIYGGPGNAKSETLIAIINELNQRQRGPAIYTTFTQILDWLRAAYNTNVYNEDYLARFTRLKNMPVIAIDEMDKARSTPWAEEFRFSFLDERYMAAADGRNYVTIFAGNTHPKDMECDVLYDRFRDGRFVIVENRAGSARPNMAWQITN